MEDGCATSLMTSVAAGDEWRRRSWFSSTLATGNSYFDCLLNKVAANVNNLMCFIKQAERFEHLEKEESCGLGIQEYTCGKASLS